MDENVVEAMEVEGEKSSVEYGNEIDRKRGALYLNQFHKLREVSHDVIYFISETDDTRNDSVLSDIVNKIKKEHELDVQIMSKNIFLRELPETKNLIVIKTFQQSDFLKILKSKNFNTILSLRAFTHLYVNRLKSFYWTKSKPLDSWVLQGKAIVVAGVLTNEESWALQTAGMLESTDPESCDLIVVKDRKAEKVEWKNNYREKIRYSGWLENLVTLMKEENSEDDIQIKMEAYIARTTISKLSIFVCPDLPNVNTTVLHLGEINTVFNTEIADSTKIIIAPKTGLTQNNRDVTKIQKRALCGTLEVVSSDWLDESLRNNECSTFEKFRVSVNVGEEFSLFSSFNYVCIRLCTTNSLFTAKLEALVKEKGATVHDSLEYRCDLAIFNPVTTKTKLQSCHANMRRTNFCIQEPPHRECGFHHLPLCEEDLDVNEIRGKVFTFDSLELNEKSFLASVIAHFDGTTCVEKKAPNTAIRLQKNPLSDNVKSVKWFLDLIKLDKSEPTTSKRPRLDMEVEENEDYIERLQQFEVDSQQTYGSYGMDWNQVPGFKPPVQDMDDFGAHLLEGISSEISKLGLVRSFVDYEDGIGVIETRKYSQCTLLTDPIQLGKLSKTSEHHLQTIKEVYLERLLKCENMPVESIRCGSNEYRTVLVEATGFTTLICFVKRNGESWEWQVSRNIIDTMTRTSNCFFPIGLYKFPCVVVGESFDGSEPHFYHDNCDNATLQLRTEFWLNKGAPRIYVPTLKVNYFYGIAHPNVEPHTLLQLTKVIPKTSRYCANVAATGDIFGEGVPNVGRVFLCSNHSKRTVVFDEVYEVESRSVSGNCLSCKVECTTEFIFYCRNKINI